RGTWSTDADRAEHLAVLTAMTADGAVGRRLP
ncbi:MAG: hypothetical protein QOG79_2106, partial [Mycobacterium sp.]|nr:hypothetical protein [Mycobacterium sp.]